jgi:chromatin segregation and condensation protein Rec8/ScpA/Scc1 (kleisin family)
MARAQRIDLTKLSILALVEAFTSALDAALMLTRTKPVDLGRWGEWLVMAATLALLRSRLLLPEDAPEAKAAQDEAEAYRLHQPPFWRVADAVARITHMLADRPGGGGLDIFLPTVDACAPEREQLCRTALASTFVAGLELAREGAVRLEQHKAWQDVILRAAVPTLGGAP